jgi:SAM-dependent methyltransferase
MTTNFADFYDAELERHNVHLRAAADVGVHDRVLDIGCGAGQTTRQAARVATEGIVVGIDTSAEMLEIARQRATEAGLRNAVFELGDAQGHAFPPAGFDLCMSRFGVMFFADRGAAFANLGRAVRPGGRLTWMVWQSQKYNNEWSTAIRQALGLDDPIPTEAAAAFSLGDPAIVTEQLSAAGFTSIDFAEVHEPVFYGQNVDAARDALTSFEFVKTALARADVPDNALRRLRGQLEAHSTADGVFFDSRACIVTALRD